MDDRELERLVADHVRARYGDATGPHPRWRDAPARWAIGSRRWSLWRSLAAPVAAALVLVVAAGALYLGLPLGAGTPGPTDRPAPGTGAASATAPASDATAPASDDWSFPSSRPIGRPVETPPPSLRPPLSPMPAPGNAILFVTGSPSHTETSMTSPGVGGGCAIGGCAYFVSLDPGVGAVRGYELEWEPTGQRSLALPDPVTGLVPGHYGISARALHMSDTLVCSGEPPETCVQPFLGVFSSCEGTVELGPQDVRLSIDVRFDGERCSIDALASPDLGHASPWSVAAAVDRQGPVLELLVTESACASGRSAFGRIPEPAVAYGTDAVTITTSVVPLPGDVECPSNAPTRYPLVLAEPIGHRTLLDGSADPPRVALPGPVTTPTPTPDASEVITPQPAGPWPSWLPPGPTLAPGVTPAPTAGPGNAALFVTSSAEEGSCNSLGGCAYIFTLDPGDAAPVIQHELEWDRRPDARGPGRAHDYALVGPIQLLRPGHYLLRARAVAMSDDLTCGPDGCKGEPLGTVAECTLETDVGAQDPRLSVAIFFRSDACSMVADATVDPPVATPWALGAPVDGAGDVLFLLLTERDCAGGRTAFGRIPEPVVEYGPASITVTVSVVRMPGISRCPANPESPYTLRLSEPIGDRELLDGSVEPPRAVPDPPG